MATVTCIKCKTQKPSSEFFKGLKTCYDCSRAAVVKKRQIAAVSTEKPYNYLQIDDKTALIPVKNGSKWATAVVDLENAETIARYNWYLDALGYVIAKVNGKTTSMHAFVMGSSGLGLDIDHIYGIKSDNRADQLKFKSRSANLRNRHKFKDNGIVYVGAYLVKNGEKWHSQITVSGKPVYIGRFLTHIEAARARDRKVLELFPDDLEMYLNFPRETYQNWSQVEELQFCIDNLLSDDQFADQARNSLNQRVKKLRPGSSL